MLTELIIIKTFKIKTCIKAATGRCRIRLTHPKTLVFPATLCESNFKKRKVTGLVQDVTV